ncbi:UvrD/REP helicase N-terminal domain-containing protein [Microterricola viridarii]|uniref:UvrD/REP helicase N-terminal domain-containing protein n=1 Tax=Microterricola viridarii TaxID=412690 RepID=A0A1H1VA96_9MICO|nr:UvrD/REP helicase N-terminal domain-containing protein [Microterricola viridarii]
MVERYRQVASQPGQFASLVSFTNSAVNEVRKRCASQPHLLQHPNFVGTFDAFFHRFVTTPSFLRTEGKQLRYVASWDDLPDHWSRLRPPKGGTGFPLTAFEPRPDGRFQIVEKRLSRLERAMWTSLPAFTRNNLAAEAATRNAHLASAGIMSAESARSYALGILHTAEGTRILERLHRRFSELIVDEFQDCNETEIQLLELLQEKGLAIVAVADPDQAIYNFRQVAAGDIYRKFRDTVPESAIAPLNECHRSTQSICDVVTSLRSISPDPVVASPTAPAGSPHVYVFKGKRNEIMARANTVLQTHGISPQDARVLAHGSTDARQLLHHQSALTGNSSARRVLHAILELRGRGTATHRLSALNALGRVFLSAIEQPGIPQTSTMDETLAILGIEAATLRLLSKRLVTTSQQWQNPDDYATSLSAVISEGFAEFGLNPKSQLKVVFPKPKPDLWAHWTNQVDGLSTDTSFGWQWSNIHQVKGGEFDAILMSIPSKARGDNPHALDDWETNTNSEQRRVLYVGASRAQRVLMFWPEGQRYAQLVRILKRDGIPYLVV